MTRLALGLVMALAATACDGEASSLAGPYCTEARDPTGFYCTDSGRNSSFGARRRFDAPSDTVFLFVDSSPTGTLGPDGLDFEWEFFAQIPSRGILFYWELNAFNSTPAGPAAAPLDGCEEETAGLSVLDSRVLVAAAIDRYEAEVGPVVQDDQTRTAFRQRAACVSPTGEATAWWSYTRWNEESEATQTAFVLFDDDGELLELRTDCPDERRPGLCM